MTGSRTGGMPQTSATVPRVKVVLYNPGAVFFTMRLALLAIGSELDLSRGKHLFQRLVRYRCRRDEYRWPLDMGLARGLVPAEKLS